MKKLSLGKNKALKPVIMVMIAAALSVWALTWYNTRRVATGKAGVGGLGFSLALLGAGFASMFVKRLKPISAPVLMVGAVLAGVEAVKNIGPMNGLASRYRRGQDRPAMVTDGLGRPAVVESGMGRPADVTRSGWAGGSGRASWGNRR